MEIAVENITHKFTKAVESNFTSGIFSHEAREEAKSLLENNRFPNTRDEYWKYTRLNRISTKNFLIQPANIQSIDLFNVSDLNSIKIVFVNGFFSAQFSDFTDFKTNGIDVFSKGDFRPKVAHSASEIFDQLNTCFATDGIRLHIGKNIKIEPTIEIIHIQTGTEVIANLYHEITIEPNAQAEVVMSFYSQEALQCFTNVRSSVELKDGAHLSITKLQAEDNNNYHIATENINQGANSNFTINTITLGGELLRNNLNIAVNGQNCETNLNAAYILKENQHVDNHTLVDHRVANCLSNELYKGVMNDKSTAVFNGKVFVRKDAQKINAFQSNGNVLLSNDATVNSKPELEIYADDVKCSHGSTTGQLDENAVFYLRSRGMSEKQARELLVQAFIGDVLSKLSDPLRFKVDQILEDKFGWEFLS